MAGITGLVGVLLLLAGAHLLWQARGELAYWFETYLKNFRVSLRRADVGLEPGGLRPTPTARERRTLRMIMGFGLVVLSQLLLVLEFLI